MHCQQRLDELIWRDVPDEVVRLAKEAAGPYSVIQDLMPYLPDIQAKVWYNPYMEKVAFGYPLGTDSDKVASWHIALKQVPGVEIIEHGYFYSPPDNQPFIMVKKALSNPDVFGPIASAMQLKGNALNRLWGGPNPLASTIAGGLLGAGLGYGAGWLGEQLLPEEYFEKGKLRRTLGILGGIGGAVPGLWWGYDNMRAHPDPDKKWSWRSWLSHYPVPPEQIYPERTRTGQVEPEIAQGSAEKIGRFENRTRLLGHIRTSLSKIFPPEVCELDSRWVKYAEEYPEGAGGTFNPMIPVDQFNRTIWNDLRGTGGYTPAPLAAATTGITQAASLASGTNFISPADIARIGMGMGSGWLSGTVVGKTLGALAGLRPEAQEALQRTGTWAGILGNVVPIIFR
jgi:hypothetical protein